MAKPSGGSLLKAKLQDFSISVLKTEVSVYCEMYIIMVSYIFKHISQNSRTFQTLWTKTKIFSKCYK